MHLLFDHEELVGVVYLYNLRVKMPHIIVLHVDQKGVKTVHYKCTTDFEKGESKLIPKHRSHNSKVHVVKIEVKIAEPMY